MRPSASRFRQGISRSAAGQGGFSLLELVIVIILIILLFVVAQHRLLPLRGAAEGTQVASVVGALRSALGMEFAARIVHDGPDSVTGLENMNPMTLLQERPDGYLGVRSPSPRASVPAGAWLFDPETEVLVYRVRFPQYLAGSPDPPVDLHWQVQLRFDDHNDSGGYESESDRLRGVKLVPLHAHGWPDQPLAGRPDDAPRRPSPPR